MAKLRIFVVLFLFFQYVSRGFEEVVKKLESDGFHTENGLYIEKMSYQHVDILSEYLRSGNIFKTYMIGYKKEDWDSIDKIKKYLMHTIYRDNCRHFVIKAKKGTKHRNGVFKEDTVIGVIGFSMYKECCKNNEVINNVLWPSYWIAEKYQRNGFMKSIAIPLIKRVFMEAGDVQYFCTTCVKGNVASEKILTCSYEQIKLKCDVTDMENQRSDKYSSHIFFCFHKKNKN